ncbi:hypothetical protein FA13DRAFT_1705449 [Coprinellus micaceus]|uniref:Uncharacterized protein n=1 Tax=Coprinellus micaceus TaxID=71717 RepID=A0A4Y7TTE2_COPMI|nr:hypothetical protein FA13DRAFT_1705449 [Coprinellus micaceus]
MEEPQDLTKGKQKGNTGRASLAFSHNPLPYKEHTDEDSGFMEVDAFPGTNERQVFPLSVGLLADYASLTEDDLAQFLSPTPDGSVVAVDAETEGLGESSASPLKTHQVWGSEKDEFVALLGQDSTPLEEWTPQGVDLSWTGRNLHIMAVSRHYLETYLSNLVQARDDSILHYRRSLQIRQDLEKSYHTIQRSLGIAKDHSQLIEVFNGQDLSEMEGTVSS